MPDSDHPFQSPEPQRDQATIGRRGPSVLAISLVLVASYLLAFCMTPMDPISFYIGWAVLAILALSSYFAGYLRGSRNVK